MTDRRDYDYVIVGGGTAGCILAARLTEDPAVRVLLLEAGGSDRSWKVRMPSAYDYLFKNPKFNWCYEGEPEPALGGRRGAGVPQRRDLVHVDAQAHHGEAGVANRGADVTDGRPNALAFAYRFGAKPVAYGTRRQPPHPQDDPSQEPAPPQGPHAPPRRAGPPRALGRDRDARAGLAPWLHSPSEGASDGEGTASSLAPRRRAASSAAAVPSQPRSVGCTIGSHDGSDRRRRPKASSR